MNALNNWLRNHGKVGSIFIVISMLGVILCGVVGYKVLSIDVDRLVFQSLRTEDLGQSLINLRVDETKQLFNLGLLMLGGLWAAVMVKREISLDLQSHFPEFCLFSTATLLLLVAQLCHVWYLGYIHEAVLLGAMTSAPEPAIPNVFENEPIENVHQAQKWILLLGIFFGALMLLSSRYRYTNPKRGEQSADSSPT